LDGFGDIKMATRLKASIIGITGYTGLEQLRMLLAHPRVDIAYLTSRQHDDVKIGDVHPHLSHLDLTVTNTDHVTVAKNSDIVFLALPHKTAQDVVAEIHGLCKVIDHSADYRLDDAETYTKYYGVPHNHPELLGKIPYGLPELNKEIIKKSSTVANPGCFAILSQLMLYPYAGYIEHVDIMAVTGSSGAGKSPVEGTHHPVRNHNLKSYGINTHRHIPEIIRTAKITEEQLNFVPTSGPFTRGIFATAFVKIKLNANLATYKKEPFLRFVEEVSLANVVGSNFCDLSHKQIDVDSFIVQGAIDNLVKGAAGTAIQNMNLMFGFKETEGLDILMPVYP
jgi:N-acetyl-gamma-glutamyl-phosphate reductase